MKNTMGDAIALENWWIDKSRKNFFAYRCFLREGNFKHNWFINDLCQKFQQFYVDYLNGKRPVLIINTPPQHGKSWCVADFVTWLCGLDPSLRVIYASFSERLGIRCNLSNQRTFDTQKYKNIFPEFLFSNKNVVSGSAQLKRNSSFVEFTTQGNDIECGYFRNTTVMGAITGETIDIGIIDDPVKGRAEAESPVISQRIWEWWEDDFSTRFSDKAGLIGIQTRWTTHDWTARMQENNPNAKIINYQAISTKDEKNRKDNQALFPELKSLSFLENMKATRSPQAWESIFQGNPTISGGNLFKDDWWEWYSVLPPIKYKFITADTAQKTKVKNDWTVFQCWGVGVDGRLYLIDKFRKKMQAPSLRKEAEIFYRKHDLPKENVNDPILRGMYIEDKSSGTGLIQELKKIGLKIVEVQRSTDKNLRANDGSVFVRAGRVCLSTQIVGIDNLTKEAREFPASQFDDDLDALLTAIEIAYINKNTTNSLEAAMMAV